MLLLLACTPDPPGPASPGSRSAELASRAGEVGRRAAALAGRIQEIEGDVDRWREAPPEQRAAIEASIRERALDAQIEARALQDEVLVLEAGARAWGEPFLPELEGRGGGEEERPPEPE